LQEAALLGDLQPQKRLPAIQARQDHQPQKRLPTIQAWQGGNRVSDKSRTVEEVLSLLTQTPPRLTEICAGVQAVHLHTAPVTGEWSANEVLAHLRSCADVWGDCIATILAEDKPTIRAINPRSWIKRTNYPELEFGASLEAFIGQRAKLLAVLQSLPPESWARSATITGAGAPLERTLLSFAYRLGVHERPHVKQIATAIKMVQSV
jgi:DinB superfamily